MMHYKEYECEMLGTKEKLPQNKYTVLYTQSANILWLRYVIAYESWKRKKQGTNCTKWGNWDGNRLKNSRYGETLKLDECNRFSNRNLLIYKKHWKLLFYFNTCRVILIVLTAAVRVREKKHEELRYKSALWVNL